MLHISTLLSLIWRVIFIMALKSTWIRVCFIKIQTITNILVLEVRETLPFTIFFLYNFDRDGATIRTVVICKLPGGELHNRELAGATIRTVRLALALHMVCRCPAAGWAPRQAACGTSVVPARTWGEPPRVGTETVNGFKAWDPSGQRSPPFHS